MRRKTSGLTDVLTLICGLPNAGKTTYSKRFENVVHLDEERRTANVCEKVKGAGDVVVEGVFASRPQRERLIRAYGGRCRCIFIDITLDECIRREDRGRSDFILRNAYKHFTPPTLDEGWDEIEVVR